MIDSGQIDYALVVNGEDAALHPGGHHRPAREPGRHGAGRPAPQFATLTLGSGAAAMVLGRADPHPEGHRLRRRRRRAGTEHHELCVGDIDVMRTDLKGLLDAGLALSGATWDEARRPSSTGPDMDRYVIHQVSQVHTRAMCEALGIDPRAGAADLPDLTATSARPRCRSRWPRRPTRCTPATGCC